MIKRLGESLSKENKVEFVSSSSESERVFSYNLCESCVLLRSFSKFGLLLVIWLLQIQNATPSSMTSQRYGSSCPFCPFGLVDWGRQLRFSSWASLHHVSIFVHVHFFEPSNGFSE
ncbi:hypothetical protein YC2023_118594 [Brassica napus]